MRTAKEYRRIAWNAIRPHLRAMLLIALTAVLPQLIEFFLQLLFGLIPPIDMQFWFSDPSRFLAAYDAFVVQTLAPNLLLNVLFNCLSVPLTLGLIGAAQRLLRGEDVQARHSLTYVPYSLRAIGLEIRIVLYAFWPLLALAPPHSSCCLSSIRTAFTSFSALPRLRRLLSGSRGCIRWQR